MFSIMAMNSSEIKGDFVDHDLLIQKHTQSKETAKRSATVFSGRLTSGFVYL